MMRNDLFLIEFTGLHIIVVSKYSADMRFRIDNKHADELIAFFKTGMDTHIDEKTNNWG